MNQELGLILGKADAKGAFLSEWNMKYVPAILSYGEKSRKTTIVDLITSMNASGKYMYILLICNITTCFHVFVTDETSRQLTALKVLSKSFGYRQIKDNLPFIYEEYDVSFYDI